MTRPDGVRTVIAQVAAYQLGAYGHLAGGRTTLRSGGSDRYPAGTAVVANRISGHRDTGRTACPSPRTAGTAPPARASPPPGAAAADRAGNAKAGSVTRTPVVVAEAAASRTGAWTALRDPPTSAAARCAAPPGRERDLAVHRALGGAGGRPDRCLRVVSVFLDGAAAGTIGLRSAVPRNRQAVWAKNLGASGTHTVKVVVAGAARRPGVVLDGLVVLR